MYLTPIGGADEKLLGFEARASQGLNALCSSNGFASRMLVRCMLLSPFSDMTGPSEELWNTSAAAGKSLFRQIGKSQSRQTGKSHSRQIGKVHFRQMGELHFRQIGICYDSALDMLMVLLGEFFARGQ